MGDCLLVCVEFKFEVDKNEILHLRNQKLGETIPVLLQQQQLPYEFLHPYRCPIFFLKAARDGPDGLVAFSLVDFTTSRLAPFPAARVAPCGSFAGTAALDRTS